MRICIIRNLDCSHKKRLWKVLNSDCNVSPNYNSCLPDLVYIFMSYFLTSIVIIPHLLFFFLFFYYVLKHLCALKSVICCFFCFFFYFFFYVVPWYLLWISTFTRHLMKSINCFKLKTIISLLTNVFLGFFKKHPVPWVTCMRSGPVAAAWIC